nr:immunoglobulin heavy chain junction region [Macaca mulatta]MOW79131.1 immunoglobulin heavy chain junction region [Macaca mulatta]
CAGAGVWGLGPWDLFSGWDYW